MWPEMLMAHQGSSLPNTIMYPKIAKQQYRGLRTIAAPLPIAPGKFFKNPNFVNKFDKYENGVKPVDNMKYKNSCQAHIVDSIKLKCPEVIPNLEGQPKPYSVTELNCKMYLDNIEDKTKNNKKDMGELLKEEIIQDMSDNSQDLSPNSQHQGFKAEILVNEDITMFLNIKDLQSLFRGRQYSVTDSEESFDIRKCKGNDEHTAVRQGNNSESKESVCLRSRYPSVCESEDSFIMFERDDVVELEDDIYSQSSSEDDFEEDTDNEDQENGCDEVDSSYSLINQKKVRFASSKELCKVHPMIKWSYAYQAARKGPWEMYARDRARFKERVLQVERDIQHIFAPDHRARIYKERFENL